MSKDNPQQIIENKSSTNLYVKKQYEDNSSGWDEKSDICGRNGLGGANQGKH
jgi:hypothetical protein